MRKNWFKKFIEQSKKALSDKQVTEYLTEDGYSIVGEYNKRHKGQFGILGNDNIVPFIKVFFLKDKIDEYKEYIPLWIDVGVTSKVIENGQAKYMVNDSRIKRLKPLNFMSKDDFYVSKKDGKIYEKRKETFKVVDYNKFYDRLYKAHVSSVWGIRGLLTRIRILILRKLPVYIGKLITLLSGSVYWWVKGSFYKYDVIMATLVDSHQNETGERVHNQNGKTITFFNYSVEIWTLATFSLLVIVMYTFFKDASFLQVKSNNSLSFIYPITLPVASIILYDNVLPRVLKFIIMNLEKGIFKLNYKGVNVKI